MEGDAGPGHVMEEILSELLSSEMTSQFTGRVKIRKFCRHKDGSIGMADLIGAKKENHE